MNLYFTSEIRGCLNLFAHRRPKLTIRGVILCFFFYFYANVQRNVTWGIYYYLTIELDHAKRDSRLAAYGGVVLQRLEGLNLQLNL